MKKAISTKQPDLASQLSEARQASGLSMGQLAERSGIDKGLISRMESGETLSPQRSTLDNLAAALRLEPAVLHAAAGYLGSALPSLPVYFRSRYKALPDEALADVERYVERLHHKYGLQGPATGEDEEPEGASEAPQRPAARRKGGAR